MKIILTISILTLAAISSVYSQSSTLVPEDITQHSLSFNWDNKLKDEIVLEYGLTKSLELGEVRGSELKNLKDATFYYVKAKTIEKENYQETSPQLFSTASKSTGDITVYFNNWVDNNASAIADAIHNPSFEDTIVAFIGRALTTLDICNYNTGSLPIVNAVNAAAASGVVVRYIAADNTGTNNDELANLSTSIPMIQRPADGEVMHNKFIISDAADPLRATILTGSTNHTNMSCTNDFNNMVIIQDQSLALAYELEFEEMWGSNGNSPDLVNAKFGNAKTDNTPHSFSIGGVPVELYFSPSDGTTSHIVTAIESANTDMQFALLTFTNNALGDAVLNIFNAAVDVKGIIENVYYFGSEFSALESAGVDVFSHFTVPYFFHHKYAIIDANNTASDPIVVTGSHNWSNSAEDDYDENTLIIHDAVIANMYYEEFMARYADMVSVDNSKNQQEKLSLFPNPASERIYIRANERIEALTIYNSLGEIVFKQFGIDADLYEMETGFLIPGINYIQVQLKTGLYREKIVIK